jgi:hypothetical protein
VTDIADLYVVQVHCDYGPDDDFTFESEAAARACFASYIGQPDVRRVYLDGPGVTDEWSL